MKSSAISAVALTLAAALFASAAHADDYSFQYVSERFVGADILGTIYGLNGNGLDVPTSVSVVGYTSPELSSQGEIPGSDDFTAADSVFSGGFEVVNGQIVGGVFTATNTEGTLTLDGDGSYATYTAQTGPYTYSDADQPHGGGSGPVYTPYTSSAPEPAAWALLMLGVAGIGLALRKAKNVRGTGLARSVAG
ncbi:MAG: PEP-CTERM sorting domain-containing protein [Caulobacteraceae bacterium]